MTFNICDAIKNRQVIQFYYDGGIREVEPFCYGENSKGNFVLRGFQIGGHSSSGNSVGWKLFKLNDMSSISLTGSKFNSIRQYYNPNDKGMIKIICNV